MPLVLLVRTERIWPRNSFEAPATNDARLVENEERLRRKIRKRKLRLYVVGVVVFGGGGSFGEFTLPSLGVGLHAEPTQRYGLASAGGGKPAPVRRSGRREGSADDGPGHASRRPPRYRRRRRCRARSLTARLFRHRRRVTSSRRRSRSVGHGRKSAATGSSFDVVTTGAERARLRLGHVG